MTVSPVIHSLHLPLPARFAPAPPEPRPICLPLESRTLQSDPSSPKTRLLLTLKATQIKVNTPPPPLAPPSHPVLSRERVTTVSLWVLGKAESVNQSYRDLNTVSSVRCVSFGSFFNASRASNPITGEVGGGKLRSGCHLC